MRASRSVVSTPISHSKKSLHSMHNSISYPQIEHFVLPASAKVSSAMHLKQHTCSHGSSLGSSIALSSSMQ